MLVRRLMVALGYGLVVAACGGKVAPDQPQSEPIPALTPTSTSTPPGTPTQSPPSPPSPTVVPTVPPAGPIPKGEVGACGLYTGNPQANLKSFALAQAIGVYRVSTVTEECSGAGGTHLTLVRVDGCTTRNVVHYGGHACSINWQVGDLAMVGVDPTPGSIMDTGGWCLESVKPWDGVARAVEKLAPAVSPRDALAGYGCVR